MIALTSGAKPETYLLFQNALLEKCQNALNEAIELLNKARRKIKASDLSTKVLEQEASHLNQFQIHGLAWYATYVEALTQALRWAEHLETKDEFNEVEQLLLQVGFASYLNEIASGIYITQLEVVRPIDLGLQAADLSPLLEGPGGKLIRHGNSQATREKLAELISNAANTGHLGKTGLDETMEIIRNQFRRFAEEHVTPRAQSWHLEDALIPMETIQNMNELGVFGLTIPTEYGGLGLSKIAMCVVSEELSRGYIGVGSLATRSEIAAELILCGGTEEQKKYWLPLIATGKILPTAVFTEPDVGSDLASIQTRANRIGDTYIISGNKTWITHAARANMMTLLARTNPDESGYRGLSMFLAEKTPGTQNDPFPSKGMSGGEIKVIGYRGMKEYEINFDEFVTPKTSLLGEEEGNGFKQLMATFESARIQTAARAIGVAQNALELGIVYALQRSQFGQKIYHFPRVNGKLTSMSVEIMMARQLTYHAAREKDEGRRCDLVAGMAKMLAAKVAWASADCSLQIHGGNGFSIEYPISRVLADARILSIFEGASEIQAQVIGRRLIEDRN